MDVGKYKKNAVEHGLSHTVMKCLDSLMGDPSNKQNCVTWSSKKTFKTDSDIFLRGIITTLCHPNTKIYTKMWWWQDFHDVITC